MATQLTNSIFWTLLALFGSWFFLGVADHKYEAVKKKALTVASFVMNHLGFVVSSCLKSNISVGTFGAYAALIYLATPK